MSKIPNGLQIPLTGAAIFQAQNPELVEFMNSPEEQERFEKEMKEYANKEDKNESKEDENQD